MLRTQVVTQIDWRRTRVEDGWIYVLVNSSMPGMVKVGRTTPHRRATAPPSCPACYRRRRCPSWWPTSRRLPTVTRPLTRGHARRPGPARPAPDKPEPRVLPRHRVGRHPADHAGRPAGPAAVQAVLPPTQAESAGRSNPGQQATVRCYGLGDIAAGHRPKRCAATGWRRPAAPIPAWAAAGPPAMCEHLCQKAGQSRATVSALGTLLKDGGA